MTSQNGWPLIDSSQLDNSPIPGANVKPVPGILKGDVAWLLRWVGSEFNKRVDPLITPGCWGWNALTPIPGSNIYSNHCSGTAIDLNAPHFPWTLKTMSTRQREECRKIVNQTEGVVAWGGDFTTKTDEMHFEINGTSQDVARVVKKLKGGQMDPDWQHQVTRLSYALYLNRGLSTQEFVSRGNYKDPDDIMKEVAGSQEAFDEWKSMAKELGVSVTDAQIKTWQKDYLNQWPAKTLSRMVSKPETTQSLSKSSVIDYLNKNLK